MIKNLRKKMPIFAKSIKYKKTATNAVNTGIRAISKCAI